MANRSFLIPSMVISQTKWTTKAEGVPILTQKTTNYPVGLNSTHEHHWAGRNDQAGVAGVVTTSLVYPPSLIHPGSSMVLPPKLRACVRVCVWVQAYMDILN